MITDVSEVLTCRIIETDKEDYPSFRRNSPEGWERLYCSSWEEYPICEEMEAEYQQFMSKMSSIDDHTPEAYKYVESISHTADDKERMMWHGWALREAFLAGIKYGQTL
jgi:hypothetical protein